MAAEQSGRYDGVPASEQQGSPEGTARTSTVPAEAAADPLAVPRVAATGPAAALLAASAVALVLTDPALPDHPIVYANPAFLALTGYAADEVLGRNCRFLQGPATDPAAVAAMRAAIAAGLPLEVELLNYRKDGSSFWNALSLVPLPPDGTAPGGSAPRYAATLVDVSRRRDAEEALRQAQRLQTLGQLSGGIAHDMGNLLQVAVSHLELARRAPDEAGRARGLEGIGRALRHAGALSQQVLAFVRKQRSSGRALNLNGLVRSALAGIAGTLGQGIVLERALAPELWNCRLDATQTELALLNLLLNARDAMPVGGRITVSTRNLELAADVALAQRLAPGRYVQLEVTDTGAGIAPELIGRVVEPFFTTKPEGAGTGLGLAMVDGFARQAGGAFALASAPGQGTRALLSLPALDVVPETIDEL